MKKTAWTWLLACAAGAAFADTGPVGLWKTVDEPTQKERSLVRITDTGGVLTGRIEKLLDLAQADAKCDKCTDERKNQPLAGLAILRSVRKDAADASLWSGGDILDPGNGKVFKVQLKTAAGGSKLEVRGYVGSPMMGRTQTWVRVE